jgi:hypothetical protein
MFYVVITFLLISIPSLCTNSNTVSLSGLVYDFRIYFITF